MARLIEVLNSLHTRGGVVWRMFQKVDYLLGVRGGGEVAKDTAQLTKILLLLLPGPRRYGAYLSANPRSLLRSLQSVSLVCFCCLRIAIHSDLRWSSASDSFSCMTFYYVPRLRFCIACARTPTSENIS